MLNYKTLYLISGEKAGKGFWKIGSTKYKDPLKEDKKHFIECFRKEYLNVLKVNQLENAILLNIQNLIADCFKEGFNIVTSSEGISYDIPLNVLLEIYDFWFELYKSPELWDKCLGLLKCRRRLSFSNPSMIKGLNGFSAEWGAKIEELHKYRPVSLRTKKVRKDPMWF